jgi:hypothetical protein
MQIPDDLAECAWEHPQDEATRTRWRAMMLACFNRQGLWYVREPSAVSGFT